MPQAEVFNQLTLTTPAMMFPAISLLLLAYTNRYLTLSNRVRSLFESYQAQPDEVVLLQIASLRARLGLIRCMQVSGVASLLLCVVVMFCIYIGLILLGQLAFAVSLLLMILSLFLSLRELQVSNDALNILLSTMENQQKSNGA